MVSMLSPAAPIKAIPAARSPFLIPVIDTLQWTLRGSGWRRGRGLASGAGALPDGTGEKSGKMAAMKDRRAQRTRAAVLGAFNQLFLGRRRRRIRAADLIAEAGVGRSTFYDHYSSADEVLLEALRHPFATLADTAAGQGEAAATLWLVEHFWENRQRARDLFDNAGMQGRVSRLLAEMVAERLQDAKLILPVELAATQLAEAALAPLRAWTRGEASAQPAALAESLCRTGAALRAALAGT
jgi:AcrR family transcriptional regulator